MLAIKAFYENGNIQWLEKPPLQKAEIIVVFTSENEQKESTIKKFDGEETLNILDKYRGCIKIPNFDYEKERDDWLNEKYGASN